MYLLDQIAQCRIPFIVVGDHTDERWHLSGAAETAIEVHRCPTRYVLSDELTTLCTDLAYSKGARVFGCMDLLRIPATRLWVEWSYKPWLTRMAEYGFTGNQPNSSAGRYGVLLQASANGLDASMRSFWSFGPHESEVHASAIESQFRLDGPLDSSKRAAGTEGLRINDINGDPENIFPQSFHFGFEKSWEGYYSSTLVDEEQRRAVLLMSVGTVAPAAPFLLAFLLLLLNRDGLPQQSSRLEHLNIIRRRCGKQPLLEHIAVRAPMFVSSCDTFRSEPGLMARQGPRLHHVRGHLVRRANQLFWRVPHLRGSARRGIVQSRTVTWTVGSNNAPPAELTTS